jgi:hypothetical protein
MLPHAHLKLSSTFSCSQRVLAVPANAFVRLLFFFPLLTFSIFIFLTASTHFIFDSFISLLQSEKL